MQLKLTMVSTCLSGRSLLGACSETTQTVISTCRYLETPLEHVALHYFHHVMFLSHTLSGFCALMWFTAERGSTFECVGSSIIPLCKYLHKETSL